ncbi:MAG: Gfo/Idh/MocA family oxidoreductase [Clostridia bacterium]|nr:Gfo/Idh/MocA family oxidoreductase [Clostridia bacterium]
MKRVKWGIIGCGGIARKRTIPGMLMAENCEIVAVQDVNLKIAEEVKLEAKAKYAFSSFEELLKIGEIDAVYIASPLFCHKEQVIASAKAKKHVLCEKPLGLNSDEIKEMMVACEENNVKFGTAFMARFHRYHVKAKEVVESGILGELVSLKAQFSFEYPELNVWRQDIKLAGGGGFMDVGTHAIDILRFMSGLEAREVVAITGNQFYNYSVEDTSHLLAKMNNGAVMYVSSSYSTNAEPNRFEITGKNGSVYGYDTLSQTGFDAKAYIKMVGEEEKPLTFEGDHVNMYTAETSAFADAIINDTEVPVGAKEGLAAQLLIEGAYKSETVKL